MNDANKKVRKIAFLALVQILKDESKRKDIVPCLLPLLTDPSRRIRSYVAWRLHYFEGDDKEGCAKYVPLDCVVEAFLNEKDQKVQRSLRKLMHAVLGAQKSNKGE